MTALNMIVRGSAAYLITDGAFYDEQGVVRFEHSKAAISENLKMAFACSGMAEPATIADFLGPVGSQAEALAMLPAAIRAAKALNTGAATAETDLLVAVVMWDDRAGEARGWLISSGRAYLGADYRPFELVAVDQLTQPEVPLQSLTSTGDLLSDELPIEIVAERLAGLQRLQAQLDGLCYVGGRLELSIVSAAGAAKVRLGAWPDATGKQIDPYLPFEPVIAALEGFGG